MATTETPPTSPGAAMSAFIGNLQQAGMDQAAVEAAKKPDEKANEQNTQVAPPDGGSNKAVQQPTHDSGGSAGAAGAATGNAAGAKTAASAKQPEPEPDDEKWPRSAKDWDAFKSKRKEREAALAKERDTIKAEKEKLNKEIAELRKSGPSPELDALKKERDALSDQLRIVAVEQHPKFKQYFDGKITEQVELAKDIVGNGKSDEIVTLLKQPDSAWRRARIEELTAEMSTLQQSQLAGVMLNLSAINRERQGAVAGARETYEKMIKDQQEAASKQAGELKSNLERILTESLTKVQDAKTGIAAFQIKDGDDEWNRAVETRIASAKNMLTGTVKPEEAMDVMLLGIAAPAILSQLTTTLDENAKLQAQIKELSTATPTLQTAGSTGSTGAEQPQTQIKPGMNPHDAAKAFMQRINQDMAQ